MQKLKLLILVLSLLLLFSCKYETVEKGQEESFELSDVYIDYSSAEANPEYKLDISVIPAYTGSPFVVLNQNMPVFDTADFSYKYLERYSYLDGIGRCGAAYAICSPQLMPKGERGDISFIYPTGWEQNYYPFIDGEFIYNRCHLLGWQLTGEDANGKNLITGTRYMNVEGMLPFENMIADYIKETGNRVAYRVTPIFAGSNLVCNGVQMEAFSIEDNGESICFNVFCYNVQPGITIDYFTGDNWESTKDVSDTGTEIIGHYVLNTRSRKIHRTDCVGVKDIAQHNRRDYTGYIGDLIEQGYEICSMCFN